MNNNKFFSHRAGNLLRTFLLIGSMLGVLTLLGYLLLGSSGVFWALFLGGLFLIFGQRASTGWFMRMVGARPLAEQEAPALYQIVERLARRARLPAVPRLYFLPHPALNAFAVGQRGRPAIGVTDGLLRNLNQRELTNILAHEVSHIQHNDMRVLGYAMLISRITGMISTFGQLLLFISLPLFLFGRTPISWLAILVMIGAPMLNSLLMLALSRTREFDADLGAVRLTGDTQGLASALQKLERLQNGSWRGVIFPGSPETGSALFRTHPFTRERVARLLDLDDSEHDPRGPILEPIPVRTTPSRRLPPGSFLGAMQSRGW